MGRIRTIKPEFFLHEGLFDLEEESGLPIRLAFAGLWTQCDREGRFKWRPRRLGAAILPYDNVDFSRVLDVLTEAGMVQSYEVDGQMYGIVPSFLDHQHPNKREAASTIPDPENTLQDHDDNMDHHARTCTHVHAHGERKGKEGDTLSNDKGVPPPDDPWADGKTLLIDRSALTVKEAGSRIGGWIKRFGEESVGHALAQAREANAADPATYIERLLKPDIRIQRQEGVTHIMGEAVINSDTGKRVIDEMREEKEREYFVRLASGKNRLPAKNRRVPQAVS
jgi:hypothetical protein